MSNGDPPPMSGSPYIIICSIRTELLAAKNAVEKIVVVNHGAGWLCSFMELAFEAKPEDFAEISKLQHELMDGMMTLSKDEVDDLCKQMIKLFYILEKKYS